MARKILLADDSVTAQNMGRKILVDAGYDVLTVNNGSAALKRITDSKPDLIVLDVYMPGYSGLEVCQRLKDSPVTAHIPVLLTVGKLEPFKPQEARRVKAEAHIVKPFEASELLSAIARLEDSMVPQAHGPSFCTPLANAAEFSDEAVSAKTEARPDHTVANFRDFRRGKGRAAAAGSSPAGATGVSVAAAEVISPPAEKAGPAAEAVQVSGQSAAAELWQPPAAAPVLVETEEAALAPAAEMPAVETVAEVEAAAPLVEATDSSAVAGNEVAIPVEQIEPASEMAVAEQPAQVEFQLVESQHVEFELNQEVPAPAVVNTALLAQAAAPIDQQDEPMFAPAPVEEEAEAQPAEAGECCAEAPETEEPKKEEFTSIEAALAVVAGTAETVEEDAPAPSDEELAAALRLLTPATGHAEVTVPLRETPAVADPISQISTQGTGANLGNLLDAQRTDADLGHLFDAEAAGDVLVGPRWMAEAVALTPEEAAMLLEAEMFRTFAAAPAEEIDSEPAVNLEPAVNSEPVASSEPVANCVSTITAAVENRPAEAELTVAEAAKPAEPAPAEPILEEAPKAMAAAAAAESSAAVSAADASAIASIVDRVLADLRPKIVEEIAKSLGKKQNS